MKYILAIDLGGTKIAVGIVNFQGKVLSKLIEPTQIKLGPRGVIRQMIRMGKQVQTNADRTQTNTEGQCGSVSSQCKSVLMGVGIGAAGPMDAEKGIIISGGGANLRNVDEFFKRMTGVECYTAEEALFCVAKGSGLILDHLDVYKRTLLNKR